MKKVFDMFYCTMYFAFFVLQSCSLDINDGPVVKTQLGVIKGQYKQSYRGRWFSAFEGIPYAKPPVGNLRFKEPQDMEPWLGIWNATVLHECMQLSPFINTVVGSEDCLYLNVYVPKDKPSTTDNLDVIVYIHGGAFVMGSSAMASPVYLMDRDVIFVSMNYRLNVLGFLSTEDDVVPGNNGLKDQSLALKWIKRNIQQFGGNPQSVTIAGTSAGGASVHFHYFSSLSKGLFHRGFSQSGTAFDPWALQEDLLVRTRKLALAVGCDNESTDKIVGCMQKKPAEELIQNTEKLAVFDIFPIASFGPVIEKKSESAFLPDYPYNLLIKGHINDVPWMSSITVEEGRAFTMGILENLYEVNEQWNILLPHILDYNETVSDLDRDFIADRIKEFYFDGQELTNANKKELIKLMGDRYFVLGYERSSRIQGKVAKSSVHSFVYGYNAEQTYNETAGLNFTGMKMERSVNDFIANGFVAPTHGEDTLLLYPRKPPSEKLSEADELIKEFLLNILTTYAKDGRPEAHGITWTPISNSTDFEFLFVENPNKIKMTFKKELAPSEFWDALPIMENGKVPSEKENL